MKKQNFIRIHTFVIAVAITVITGTATFGQQIGKLAQMQNDNAEKLREYSWKSRTEIRKGGETKVVKLDQVRYAIDGTQQQTQLSKTEPELPTSGLRGMIAKKKKEQFAELIDGLTTLAKSYGRLSPTKTQQLIENASITPDGKLIRIQGSNILQPGDSMTIWLDPVSRKQRKIEVRAMFEGKAIKIVSDFRDLADGPTYLARGVIEYPDEELVVTTDNFDHVREPRKGGVATL